jgi:DNA-binding CsgD family transcriptional regulator
MIAAVRARESRTLVVRGEAGVGKTALLNYAVQSASELHVLRAVGVESEMELAFASLHQLCAPLLGHLAQLPGPQREALEIAFGTNAGAAPDRFFVGLAVLSLLSDAAVERPILCVVDDAQWLDQASAQTLAFVARRLFADPVGLVFVAREPSEEFRGLPELDLQGLRHGDARELLASVLPFPLDERVRDRIVAETRGNPLALLELPRGLTATQLAGGFGLVDAVPLSGRIEKSFLQRIEVLPAETRSLLLAAAAEPTGDPLVVWSAAERLGIGASAFAAAESGGLLAIDNLVRFRHPLVRSAAYRAASREERRAAHLALAEVTDPEVDADRRAWHLATAAEGPDEEVALELERSARRAQARGGVAASAAFLLRAVALTRDPARRTERALAAAEASLRAGAFEAALGLVATADAGALDDFQRARVDLVRGHAAFASGSGGDAALVLLRAGRRLEPLDSERARQTYLTAWGVAYVTRDDGDADVLLEICHAVQALALRQGTRRPLDLLLEGLALLTTDGHAAATPMLQRAGRALAEISVEDSLRWGWMATAASNAVWDNDTAHAIAARQAQLVREAGALADLPLALAGLGMALAWTGDFAGAASAVAEADDVAAATGSRFPRYAFLRLQALQGREADASAALAGVLEDGGAPKGVAIYAHWASAVLHNGLARYAEALLSARQCTSDPFEYWVCKWALPELVEAAARGGDAELARNAVERLAETTQPAGNDFALGMEARSRALVTDGAAAEDLYRDAIARLGRTQLRPELARAHLLYGEWLRREGRRIDAREQLRIAHEMLAEIGMEAFAERARRELVATGVKVRVRLDETRDRLTPQEEQIARLARDGLSNTEIGARLFISPRTVEWHLHKVFAKLGISSRKRLRAALPSGDRPALSV